MVKLYLPGRIYGIMRRFLLAPLYCRAKRRQGRNVETTVQRRKGRLPV